MPDAPANDNPARVEAFGFARTMSVYPALHVAPDRKADRPGLACRWMRDRTSHRLVGVWSHRRREIVI